MPLALQLSLFTSWIAALSCQAPVDRLDMAVKRHSAAVARLPEEGKLQLLPPSRPIEPPPPDPLPEAGILTIDQARAIAMQSNPDVHASQARLELALARVAEVRSRYYPNLSFTHTTTNTFQTPANRNRLATALQPTSTIPTDSESPPALVALLNALRRPFLSNEGDGDTNSFSENASSLSTSWLLFDGFVREANLMAAKYTSRASSQGVLDVQRLVVRSVEAAYHQVQLAREQIRIARSGEEFAREQFEETRKLQAAGRASSADVDNFRVRMLGAQAELTSALGLQETGRVILAELMGVEGSQLPPELVLSALEEETAEEMAAPEASDYMSHAVDERPDLRQLEELVRAEDENVRATYGLYQPVVSMVGSWGFNRTSNIRYEVDDQSSAAGVEVRWELFTGGARAARVRAAESSRAEVTAVMNRQKLAVESEVRRAVIDVRNAQDEIVLQRENLATAFENRRIVQAGYVAGKETLSRLNEAQRDYITTDANLALARIRLRQAWSDLRAAAALNRISEAANP